MPDDTKSEPVPSTPTTEGGENEAQLAPLRTDLRRFIDDLKEAKALLEELAA
jgi:hypothetical protein